MASFKDVVGVGVGGGWKKLKPDAHHDWLNQRDPGFAEFIAMGDKSKGSRPHESIFENYSLGLQTGRDAWCYNYSQSELQDNIEAMASFYNSERRRLKDRITGARRLTNAEVTQLISNDPGRISWSSSLKNDLRRNRPLTLTRCRIAPSQYRPFTRQLLYFGRMVNHSVSQIPKIFPHAEAENRVICVTGRGESDDFSCLMVQDIPNYHLIASGQCFPRWLYSKAAAADEDMFGSYVEADNHGYIRRSAIPSRALESLNVSMTIRGGGTLRLMRTTCFTTFMACCMSPPIEPNSRPI